MADQQRSFQVPAGRCLSVAPGLPTTDMARTVEHYRRLGFAFNAAGARSLAEAEFAIAGRDGIELHFAVKQDHDPRRTATWVYIGVEDADVMNEELNAAGAGQGRPVRDTDYQMREFAHIDPDGNLLLFGSPRPEDGAEPPGSPAAQARTLSDTDRAAFELLRFVKLGDADALTRMLGADPGLAWCWINGVTPLHHFADAPGHRPNAAVLGRLDAVAALVDASPPPDPDDLSGAFWNACRAGQLDSARYLLAQGADRDWPAPWDGSTPLDAASASHQHETTAWLRARGARPGRLPGAKNSI